MESKKQTAKTAFLLLCLVVLIIAVVFIVKKYTPSKETMELTKYYSVDTGKIMLVMQDEVYEEQGLYKDGMVYVDINTIQKYFNHRFYWDANENILIYTTPNEIIKTEVGSKYYYINKSKTNVDYQIVKTDGEKTYVAIDYVKLYTNLEYKIYKNPNRIVFRYKWNEKYSYSEIKKEAALRTKDSIKSPILYTLEPGEKVYYTPVAKDETIDSAFAKVITKDGIVGYIKVNRISDKKKKMLKNDYKEVTYPHITKDYKINMVWHQVTNQDANEGILNLLNNTKGVTTVSPTWFALTDSKGNISSLASERYVQRAHNAGVEVWALCNDFDSQNVNMVELLSYTSRRERLINELIANAIKYNLDGINIDFERITNDAGEHFIEFIRELSVKCRSNGVILSVDNYAPGYTAQYDRKEQGEVVDYVITMAYDEHTSGSKESGSVASISFVDNAIQKTLEEVPADRTIIGVPFYTRLWKETKEGDETKISSQAYGMVQAQNVLSDYQVQPKWDEKTKQYYGQFEKDGAVYKMWLEEDESIEEKMKLIDKAKVAGVAGWKLGLEKPSVWNVIVKYVN